jgi:hypothetical protein
MMKSFAMMLALALLALVAGCGAPPRVVQGTVMSYDAESKTLVLKDEQEPRSDAAYSLAGAEAGAQPQAGDIVRLSYRDEGGHQKVIRVMNLTHQEELQKRAH